MTTTTDDQLLFKGAEWDFDILWRTHDAIETIARDDLGLDTYPNQIEIISSEQMLDAYASVGMPIMYRHWSFGKRFILDERLYRKGARGLAYEIVINSSPCISYCMEENSMALQALVIAHAAFGHNHFFKNNQLFRQWTDAEGVLDYLTYGRGYIATCEEKYGQGEVERLLDAAHALSSHGVFRTKRKHFTPRDEMRRHEARFRAWEAEQHYRFSSGPAPTFDAETRKMWLPEENLLYFLEKYSPVLKVWQREVLRIVRNIAQYFYPQKQTQIMNEGCACFVHYYILNKLHQTGRIDGATMLEILHNHTNVLTQPDFNDPRFGGINPYALGFAMMQDIKRIVTGVEQSGKRAGKPCTPEQRAEDRAWFPQIAGCGDWRGVLKDAWANYRDESFIQQYLSPKVTRDLKLFSLVDNADEPYYTVSSIHNEGGYEEVREALARTRELARNEPDIQVVAADLTGDRTLYLTHQRTQSGIPLDPKTTEATIAHLRQLWKYGVSLQEVDTASETVDVYEHAT